MQPRALADADVVGWRRRLPLVVLRVWVPLALTVLVVASIRANIAWYDRLNSVTTADVEGWVSPLGALSLGMTLALLVVLPAAPALAIWAVPVVAALDAVDPTLAALHRWWLGAAVVSGCLAVADGVGAIRQRVSARGWGPVVAPELRPGVGRRLRGARLVPGLVVGGALLCALAGGVVWVRDARAAAEFRADAELASGSVTAVSDDRQVWADVDVTTRVVRVPLHATRREAGERVQVRHSPDWSRAELVDDAFDPAGALVWTGAGLLTALVLLWSEGLRHESARTLTGVGGVAVRLRMQPVAGGRRSILDTVRDTYAVDLVPCDAPDRGGRVVVRLRLTPIQAPAPAEAVDAGETASPALSVTDPSRDDDGPAVFSDDAWDDDDVFPDDRWEDDDARWTDTNPTDAELLGWLNGPDHDQRARDRAEATVAPRREVLVVGLTHRGARPLVLDDGWWLAAAEPVGDAFGLTGELRPGRPRADWRTLWRGAERRWFAVLRRSGQVTPWLAVPLVFLAWRALWAGVPPDWRLGIHVLTWAVGGSAWLYVVRPRLAARRRGLWVRGLAVDRLVPWPRVARVLADERGIVIRLRDGAIPVPVPVRSSGWLTSRVDDPRVAAQAIQDALRRADAAPSWSTDPSSAAARVRRRPSPLVLVGALWAAAVLLPLSPLA